MTRLLITGYGGLLAPHLSAAAAARGWSVVTSGRRSGDFPADLAEPAAVQALFGQVRPDVVVHGAGFTNVDACELDPARAEASNAGTTEHMAKHLPVGCHLIYISTDQVYPDTAGPHREGEEAPVNEYGRSKLAGERCALAVSRACVLRVNFFGPSLTPGRASLSDFMVDAFRADKPVTLFDDVLFSPLHVDTLSEAILDAAQRRLTGTFNAGCRDGLSKAAFGLAIAAAMGVQPRNAIIGRSVDAYPGRAQRARDLRMDVGRLEAALGKPFPSLAEEIGRLHLSLL